MKFKSDHTFVETFTVPKESQVTTMNGIWSLKGDELQLTTEEKYNPQRTTVKSTLSINGNTMVTTAVMPASSRIVKMISTNTRM